MKRKIWKMVVLALLSLLVFVLPSHARMSLTDRLIMEGNITNQLQLQRDLNRMEQRFETQRLEGEIEDLKRRQRAITVEEYLLILQYLQEQEGKKNK